MRQVYIDKAPALRNHLRRLGVEDRDLEDKLHDVFVVFLTRQSDFDYSRPIGPWLKGIATRVAADYRRLARQKHETLCERVDLLSGAPVCSSFYRSLEIKEVVLRALRTMDRQRRRVFVLYYVEGHTIPEISQLLKMPINTLYTQLRTGREKFSLAMRREPFLDRAS